MEHLSNAIPPTSNNALGTKTMICPDHGDYQTTGTHYAIGRISREVWTPCPDCEEARLAAERQAQSIAKAEAQKARMESMLDEAAIPPRFINRSLDSFKATTDAQRHALKVVSNYAKNFDAVYRRGDGLILSGMPGTGKSHLATSVLQFVMPEYSGLYVTCMGLIRSVRGTWRRDSERSEKDVLDALAGVSLLVIDEIGVQYGTDGEQTVIFDVLDRRYRDMKPTILLTNQDKSGLKQFIGERSFDRLTETCRWVSFDWESFRPEARKSMA